MTDKKQTAMIAAIRILSEGLLDEINQTTDEEQDDRTNQRGQVKHPESDRRLKENREAA